MSGEQAHSETVYTRGGDALLSARRAILAFSLERASAKMAGQRERYRQLLAERVGYDELIKRKVEEGNRAHEEERRKIRRAREEKMHYDESKEDFFRDVPPPLALTGTLREERGRAAVFESPFTAFASEVGDARPLSWCEASPDRLHLATTSWSGACKIWDVAEGRVEHALEGHAQRCTSAAWHPSREGLVVTGSADATLRLWDVGRMDGEKCRGVWRGHEQPVTHVSFHPMGAHAASSSADGTWRLWDVETGATLLEQDGHGEGVMATVFQPDGALAVSCGQDTHSLVWDLRKGQVVLTLRGHLDDVLTGAFHPNGYQVATGSKDNTVKFWDLRKRLCDHTIAAHTNLVRCVRYSGDGLALASASFDGTARLWSTTDFTPLASLKGHDDKVIAVDFLPDNQIVTASYDKTWKKWRKEI